ncbi:MAG: hypothetical protein ACT4QG_13520 [Sporichthyaceae bacterium]
MKVLGILALGVALSVVLMARTQRGTVPDRKRQARGQKKFSIGLILLAGAFALTVAQAERVLVGACYILGLALVVNGYLEGRFARKRRR